MALFKVLNHHKKCQCPSCYAFPYEGEIVVSTSKKYDELTDDVLVLNSVAYIEKVLIVYYRPEFAEHDTFYSGAEWDMPMAHWNDLPDYKEGEVISDTYLVNQMNKGKVIKSIYPTGNREWFAYHTDEGYHTTEVVDGKVQSWLYLPITPHTDARAEMVKNLEFWRSKGCIIELTNLSITDVRKMDNE